MTYQRYCNRDADPADPGRVETVIELDPVQVVGLFPAVNQRLQFLVQSVERGTVER